MKAEKKNNQPLLTPTKMHEAILNRLVQVRLEQEEKERLSVLNEVEAALKGREMLLSNYCY